MPLDCDDLVIAKQLVNLAHRQPDVLRHIHQLEQGNRRIQDIITIRNRAHREKFIRSGEPLCTARCSARNCRSAQVTALCDVLETSASVSLATMDGMRRISNRDFAVDVNRCPHCGNRYAVYNHPHC